MANDQIHTWPHSSLHHLADLVFCALEFHASREVFANRSHHVGIGHALPRVVMPVCLDSSRPVTLNKTLVINGSPPHVGFLG
jgi:hypothetical protein